MKIIPALVVCFLLCLGCSKKNKIERQIFQDSGKWSIVHGTWNQYSMDDTILTDTSAISTMTGSFQFNKDNSGSYDFIINNIYYSRGFEWFIKDKEIFLYAVHKEAHNTSGVTDFVVTIFFSGQLSEIETGMSLTGSETIEYYGTDVLSVTFLLEKM